ADVAIELPPTGGTILTNIRVAHAHTALRYPGNISSAVSDTLRHVQIVGCEKAIDVEGNSSFNRQLTLGNCLIAGVGQAFACTNATVQAEHLTVDWCDTLGPPDAVNFNVAVT